MVPELPETGGKSTVRLSYPQFKRVWKAFKERVRQGGEGPGVPPRISKDLEDRFADFFNSQGPPDPAFVQRLRQDFFPLLQRELRNIFSQLVENEELTGVDSLPEQDVLTIGRLHGFNTLVKLVKDRRIVDTTKRWEQVLPRIYMLLEGREESPETTELRSKFEEFLQDRLAGERKQTLTGSDPYVQGHLAAISLIGGAFKAAAGELFKSKKESRAWGKQLLGQMRGSILPMFVEKLKELRGETAGESGAFTDEKAMKILRAYTAAGMIALIEQGLVSAMAFSEEEKQARAKRLTGAPDEKIEKILYELFQPVP